MLPNNNIVHNDSASYSTSIGFIFIFNLIVGTGALTLPAAFAKAGWLLSLIIIILLATISYMTVTFIVEAMACANAVKNWQQLQIENESEISRDIDDETETNNVLNRGENIIHPAELESSQERTPLYFRTHSALDYYKLDEKFELGEIAVLFFNDAGRILFYLCISIYLYGDLSIYSAAVAKSLRNIACDITNKSVNENSTRLHVVLSDNNDTTEVCWKNQTMTRFDVYRLFLLAFTVFFGPFAAFGVQKTKYLQILTVIFRWLAFTFMIAIALKMILFDGVQGQPSAANIYGLPALFGACVYSFMCHHSLPSLVTPIRNKLSLNRIISGDYVLVCSFYILLAITGIFAFEHIEDLYTLNFIPSTNYNYNFRTRVLIIIDYFLALFPIFTLSASFPIVAITLRNNLQTLFLDMTRFESYNYFVRRILFSMCAIIPPFVITYFTENITSLVAFTGSYAGAGIQYIIPISLIYYARRTCKELLGNGVVNDFQSPFRSTNWLIFVLILALICICLISINVFININGDI